MSLQSWLQNSWLVQHTTSPEEIKNLLAISDRDLLACQMKQLPADWRCTIAYNAALQAATSALAAAGYRASRDNHHYRVIQSLEFSCLRSACARRRGKVDQINSSGTILSVRSRSRGVGRNIGPSGSVQCFEVCEWDSQPGRIAPHRAIFQRGLELFTARRNPPLDGFTYLKTLS
jgi:hypothetical protein